MTKDPKFDAETRRRLLYPTETRKSSTIGRPYGLSAPVLIVASCRANGRAGVDLGTAAWHRGLHRRSGVTCAAAGLRRVAPHAPAVGASKSVWRYAAGDGASWARGARSQHRAGMADRLRLPGVIMTCNRELKTAMTSLCFLYGMSRTWVLSCSY